MEAKTAKNRKESVSTAVFAVLALALTIYHIFANSKISFALLTAFAVFVALDIIGALVAAKNTELILLAAEYAEKGESVKCVLILKKRTVFPAAHIKISLKIENSLTGELSEKELSATVFGKEKRLTITLSSTQVGALSFERSSAILGGVTHLTSKSILLKFGAKIFIMPQKKPIKINYSEGAVPHFSGERYCLHRAGEDSSEIFSLRPYREGDAYKSVHFKLSSKTDELIVREFSRPSENDIMLVFLVGNGANEGQRQEVSDLVELAYSVSHTLLSENKVFSLLINIDGELTLLRINDLETLDFAFTTLLLGGGNHCAFNEAAEAIEKFARALVFVNREEKGITANFGNEKIVVITSENLGLSEINI